ncbi:MAG: TAXI family TRAP transporter solute-binding subunit [Synergistetes bacterium]|nr:TAXI family TRAP transporter solute-binding subunit [Synergistota bacterium]MCX8128449.1 TAXI family TRAP transporter solute-binding subunit [Synergistota bacterium]MDW8193130.1 TAXI family TRAP transporter solute-binding subunit [Synergistota bacterium]
MYYSRLLLFVTIFFVIFNISSNSFAGKVYLSLVTGSIGGTYYPIGNAISNVINRNISEVYVITETGQASVANCLLLGRGEAEMAFAQNDVVNWAYNGLYLFKKPFTNIRVFASLYPEIVHIVTLKSSEIKNIYGLKGKRVAVGEIGSGTEINVRLILEEVGLSYKDMEVNYLESSLAAQRMKDGKLDAFFYTVGYPAPAIEDIAATKEIRLLSLSEELIKKLEKKHAWFVRNTIPARTYKGQDEEVKTLSVMAMWIGLSTIPSDLVYKMVKVVFDSLGEIGYVHPRAKFISLDLALKGVSTPLHEGAEAFYRERGLLQQTR